MAAMLLMDKDNIMNTSQTSQTWFLESWF
jgi:hypothetical protein